MLLFLQVTVGDVVRINWELGVDYEDIVIAEGTGLLFEWSSPFVHNLYQIRPVANIDVCSFINSEYGQVGLYFEDNIYTYMYIHIHKMYT